MKILILRFSSIGDIVLTSPVIRSLKTQLSENQEIHFATKEKYVALIEANPYLDKIHALADNEWALIRELKKENFDLIIDLHNNLRTFKIKLALQVKSYSYRKLNFIKWLYVNFKFQLLPNKHIVNRYLDAVSELGVKEDALGLEYFIPEKDKVELDWLPDTHRQGYYAVVIGASYTTKKLPLNKLIELCDRINKPIILIGDITDKVIGDQVEIFFLHNPSGDFSEKTISNQLEKKAIIYNACGKFNINQSASLIKQSKAVFSNDTGLMHIAAAFKKMVYTFWGNTTPDFGMYPYRTSFVVFENKKLKCRPCSKIGYKACPRKHFKCMNDIIFDFYIPN